MTITRIVSAVFVLVGIGIFLLGYSDIVSGSASASALRPACFFGGGGIAVIAMNGLFRGKPLDDASGKVEDAAVARTDDAVSTRLVAGHASQMRTYCTKRVEPAWPVDDEYLPGPGHEDGSEGYLRGDAFGPYETNSPEFLA